jgi:glycosyltransferase involved in cell wall biosynthesis
VKIAIMMRAMDQDSGFRAYVEGLVQQLLSMEDEHTYLLLYRSPKWLGRFAKYSKAKEILVRAPHKLAWDQVAVPYTAWRERADIIFNPKFSVPFVSPCAVAMGLQEPDWWVSPESYEPLDRRIVKFLLPFYCRKADQLFPMSQFNLEESRKYLRLPLSNAVVTYTCPGVHMRPITDATALQEFRNTWALPERFILAVTRVDHPGLDGFQKKGFYPGKNPETILRAFIRLRDRIPHHLVFAGRRVREYMVALGFTEADFERVLFITFVPYEELPKLYNTAELSVVSAYYDGCSTVMLESMACGCPVVSSETGACPEIGGGASLHANPYDPADFAAKIRRLATDPELQRELGRRSIERAASFSWEQQAQATLTGLLEAAARHGHAARRRGTPRAAVGPRPLPPC